VFDHHQHDLNTQLHFLDPIKSHIWLHSQHSVRIDELRASVLKMLLLKEKEHLAVAGFSPIIHIFNVTSKSQVIKLIGHTSSVRALVALKNERLASSDSKIIVWNLTNGLLIKNLTSYISVVLNFVAFNDDENLASFISYSNIEIWSLKRGLVIRTLEVGSDYLTSILLMARDVLASMSSGNSRIDFYNLTTGHLINSLDYHLGNVDCQLLLKH
jgi:WD40 repeat protein